MLKCGTLSKTDQSESCKLSSQDVVIKEVVSKELVSKDPSTQADHQGLVRRFCEGQGQTSGASDVQC